MAHTIRDKTKLLHRVRRIRGQLNAVEKALLAEDECSTILLRVAACRGAIDSLMAEIIEGHIQFHILVLPRRSWSNLRKSSTPSRSTDVTRWRRRGDPCAGPWLCMSGPGLPRRNTQNLDIKGMPLVEVGGLGLASQLLGNIFARADELSLR